MEVSLLDELKDKGLSQLDDKKDGKQQLSMEKRMARVVQGTGGAHFRKVKRLQEDNLITCSSRAKSGRVGGVPGSARQNSNTMFKKTADQMHLRKASLDQPIWKRYRGDHPKTGDNPLKYIGKLSQ